MQLNTSAVQLSSNDIYHALQPYFLQQAAAKNSFVAIVNSHLNTTANTVVTTDRGKRKVPKC